jgi:predicted transcriptional regulator
VRAEDAVDLVVKLMEWEHIDHVPVEDREHQLVGLLSHAAVMRHVEKHGGTVDVAAGDLMKTDVVTVSPDTPTSEAIKLMRKHKVSCLPVLQDGKLVGLVTASDFEQISAEVIAQLLG